MIEIITFIYKNFLIIDNLCQLPVNRKVKIGICHFYLKVSFLYLLRLRPQQLSFLGHKLYFQNLPELRVMFIEIFLNQSYLVKTKNKSPVIIDAGANIGLCTIFYKYLYPNSKVYCFEPDNNTFSLLQKNIKSFEFSDVCLNKKALSDKNGKTSFFSDMTGVSSETNSVFNLSDNGQKKMVMVECVRLSDFIESLNVKIGILKLDIEGSESLVLKDMTKSLMNIGNLIIEYHLLSDFVKNPLSEILLCLERNNFKFQITPAITQLTVTANNFTRNYYISASNVVK